MAIVSAQLPLGARKQPLAGGELREVPWTGKSVLRCNLANDATAQQLQLSGLTLPDIPNTTNTFEHGIAIWMGPDEWLLRSNSDPADASWQTWLGQLEEKLDSVHSALVDVSDYYTVFEMTGVHASEILARGCPLDLSDVAGNPASCTQTRIGNAAVLLLPLLTAADDQPVLVGWSAQVRWSYADYLWRLLERSAFSFN